MDILLHNSLLLSSLKREFNSVFPYLRLELYYLKPGTGRIPIRVPDEKELAELRRNNAAEVPVIRKGMTVAELEELFLNNYGLEAQIYRQSGKLWLETTLTNSWTLSQQNMEGKAISIKY